MGVVRARAGGRILAMVAIWVLALTTVATPVSAQSDNPPLITATSLDPTSLPEGGGQVTITADVIDDFGVFMVYAHLIGPNADHRDVQMLPSSESTWSGSIQIPENQGEESVSWSVSVEATDTNGAFHEVVAGEVQVAARTPFDEPPVVSDVSVSPRKLPSGGGTVTIAANATDLRGITEAYATILRPNGTSATVTLEPTDVADRFEGTYEALRNRTATKRTFSVSVTALDDIGQPGTEDAGTFTVAATPPAGLLEVQPESVAYGRVAVGSGARRWITLANDGAPGGPAVTGVLRSSGRPFVIIGADRDGLRFRILPGETLRVAVAFRPKALGRHLGELSVDRDDGRQQALEVRLAGRGAAQTQEE